jgi:hypothetical protein
MERSEIKSFLVYRCLLGVAAALLISGCAGAGIKATDPHLVGNRDMSYDHLIVPGNRIGPVQMGSSVSSAVQHLGEPDSVSRSTYRDRNYNADEVHYWYEDDCINFTWEDSGVEPEIESGWRGINVTCDKWKTADGLHVGSSPRDVISQLGNYCADNRKDGTLVIASKSGVWYWAQDRNSPVSTISVVPSSTSWNGMCRD